MCKHVELTNTCYKSTNAFGHLAVVNLFQFLEHNDFIILLIDKLFNCLIRFVVIVLALKNYKNWLWKKYLLFPEGNLAIFLRMPISQ